MRITPPRDRTILVAVALAMAALLLASGLVRLSEGDPEPRDDREPQAVPPVLPVQPSTSPSPAETALPPVQPGAVLPHGGRRIFAGNRFLVAYYGTGGSGALGVLGENRPAVMHQRLVGAARQFWRPGQPITRVYELIVTIADATPGPDGDFSHDIDRETVELYIRSAHRNGALLLLDIQPGRSHFLKVARRWAWALRYPNVGLALDPEWRMPGRSVPGRVIGSVSAAEVNRTSAWLSWLTRSNDLPEKLFVLHQFRTSMIEEIGLIQPRDGLAMVQHVDGFGTPGQKLATYQAVQRATAFHMGFKLFYDEDTRRMGPREVHRIRPKVRFVSFQ